MNHAEKIYNDGPRDWPDIIPLDQDDAPSEFPTEVLPPPLRQFVEAVAESTQTPIDLAAMLGLGVVATICMKKVVVEAREGWIEPVNLFIAVFLESGARKSPVFRTMTALIYDYERSKSGRRLVAEDVTPEALAELISENIERMAIFSAEGGGVFENILGRYAKIPNYEIYLKAHSGDPAFTDRIGRECKPLHNPALTIVVAMQPSGLREMSQKQVVRERGLLARFLYSVPKSNFGKRIANAPPVPGEIAERFNKVIQNLLNFSQPENTEEA